MILGLESAPTIETFIGFLVANLITGACIAISLMIQGQDLAKNIPENKEILKQYYNSKKVKLHSMGYYWTLAILKVVFTRLLMVAAMTYIVIDICWQGNGQYTYFLMAIFNILMFVGFGFLGLVNMYDKFNNNYIPWVIKQKEQRDERETNTSVKEAEGNSIKQGNDCMNTDSGSNILEPVHSNSNTSVVQPVMVDSVRTDNSILSGPVHPGSTPAISAGDSVKEII